MKVTLMLINLRFVIWGGTTLRRLLERPFKLTPYMVARRHIIQNALNQEDWPAALLFENWSQVAAK